MGIDKLRSFILNLSIKIETLFYKCQEMIAPKFSLRKKQQKDRCSSKINFMEGSFIFLCLFFYMSSE